MPALAMRGLVVFPNIVMHFDVARQKSIEALKSALSGDRKIFLVTQKDVIIDDPQQKDLYQIGVVAEIRQILKAPDNITRVLVEGLYKAKLVNITAEDPYMTAEIKKLPNSSRSKIDSVEVTALIRAIKDVFEQYCFNMPKMPKELMNSVMGETDPEKLFDNIVFNVSLEPEDKQQLLEAQNIISKLSLLVTMLSREAEVLDIERHIQDQVRQQIDKGNAIII